MVCLFVWEGGREGREGSGRGRFVAVEWGARASQVAGPPDGRGAAPRDEKAGEKARACQRAGGKSAAKPRKEETADAGEELSPAATRATRGSAR